MKHMTEADFEARYQADPDPWCYTDSEYERDKYRATLTACGPGPFASAVELGSSIGVFSALLAPRCRSLVTVDAAPTAVAAARARLAGQTSVTTILGTIPDAIPSRDYDLVVASEILYYLMPGDLARTFVVLRRVMPTGARLVVVHWRPAGPERPFDAAEVHTLVRRQNWLASVTSGGTDAYCLDVLERR